MCNNRPFFRIVVTVVSCLLLVTIVFLAIKYPATPPVNDNEAIVTPATEIISVANNFKVALTDIVAQIEQQQEVEASLLDELNSNLYTFENPLVVTDPYNASPLTALVIFNTPNPENIAIHVEGIDQYSSVDFTFDGYSQDHMIPVYGLYPGKENTVILTKKNQAGEENKTILKITAQPLPQELQDTRFLIDSPQKGLYQPGLNFTYVNGYHYGKSAYDINGDFRWFLTYSLEQSVYYGDDGKFVFVQGNASEGDVLIFETNALGRIYKAYYSPYGVHHDIEKYYDNYLFTGGNGDTVEDFVYEIDTETGKIVHSLDLRTVLQRSRQAGYRDLDSPDWLHLNDIQWVTGSDKILISGRNQSAVAEISWPDGEIDWILAPHYGWLPMFEQYLLEPVNENFDWAYNQHAPEILPDMDGDPDTMDILVFDNGNQRYSEDDVISDTSDLSTQGFTRMVQFRINDKEKTVEQIWQFGKEYGPLLNSTTCGSVQLLANGNQLGLFNIGPLLVESELDNGTAFEVTADSQIVWSSQGYTLSQTGEYHEYRLRRMNIYSSNANNLEIGTSAEILVPQEIMDQYGVTP